MTHASYICTTYYARTCTFKMKLCIYMYVYCIERSVNISITRIKRVKPYDFVMLDDISAHADFQVDGYYGC